MQVIAFPGRSATCCMNTWLILVPTYLKFHTTHIILNITFDFTSCALAMIGSTFLWSAQYSNKIIITRSFLL